VTTEAHDVVPEKKPFSSTQDIKNDKRKKERVKAPSEGSPIILVGQRRAAQEAGFATPAAVEASAFLTELARAVDRDLSTPDHAPATERAYAHDWDDFARFCGRHALEPLPAAPQTLALYLKALETRRSRSPAGIRAGTVGLSLPTLRRRLAAIASRHASASLETPTDHPLVRKLLRRYSRNRGTAAKKKEPLLFERLPALLMAMPDDLAAARDRALLLLGYAGAFRRAELVALDVEHLRFSKQGLYVWIAAAKNDPRKKGRELYVPRLPAGSPSVALCAVAGLERWLAAVGAAGPVFRTFDLRGRLTETRLDPGDVAHPAAAGGRGRRRRRFRRALAPARVHHQRGEEEDPDREHQAGDGATVERDRARLRRGRDPRRRRAVTRDRWLEATLRWTGSKQLRTWANRGSPLREVGKHPGRDLQQRGVIGLKRTAKDWFVVRDAVAERPQVAESVGDDGASRGDA